ncbi:response regulator [Sulfurospirillum barnesii]|uniref:Transcriptional regulatory protein n=1 Tax=Sulfurospirillum barnesii (strain ATCC 700032 / DSM 10660 / SES-3) TaxID=760154 RepID=I3XVE6_SULBS|nr:response regulator [Sulfurospirillum barnesii]AFL67920.1 response regulator of citrate/malate metabolism [Sulfurospirillum barnesii SES-3]
MIKVLIAEDDPRIALLHQNMVQKIANFEVVAIANTLNELKEYMDVIHPDLLLLDVYFPDGNGIDFLGWMRSNANTTDVILITAAKEMASLEKSLRYGVFDYLIKPIMFYRFQTSLQKFYDYKEKVISKEELSQSKVDAFFNKTMQSEKPLHVGLPKGVDSITLEKILSALHQSCAFCSASEIAEMLGINRTTARRYLEYLVASAKVEVDSLYGSVGRPERKYKLKTTE